MDRRVRRILPIFLVSVTAILATSAAFVLHLNSTLRRAQERIAELAHADTVRVSMQKTSTQGPPASAWRFSEQAAHERKAPDNEEAARSLDGHSITPDQTPQRREESLSQADQEEFSALVHRLPHLDSASDERLCKMIRESEGEQRTAFLRILQDLLKNESDAELRGRVALKLALLGRDAEAALTEALLYDEDQFVRSMALEALEQSGSENVIPCLQQLASSKEDDVTIRDGAIGAIGTIGGPTALASLYELWEAGERPGPVLHAVGHTGAKDAQIFAFLTESLHSQEREVHDGALHALCAIGEINNDDPATSEVVLGLIGPYLHVEYFEACEPIFAAFGAAGAPHDIPAIQALIDESRREGSVMMDGRAREDIARSIRESAERSIREIETRATAGPDVHTVPFLAMERRGRDRTDDRENLRSVQSNACTGRSGVP